MRPLYRARARDCATAPASCVGSRASATRRVLGGSIWACSRRFRGLQPKSVLNQTPAVAQLTKRLRKGRCPWEMDLHREQTQFLFCN